MHILREIWTGDKPLPSNMHKSEIEYINELNLILKLFVILLIVIHSKLSLFMLIVTTNVHKIGVLKLVNV